MIKSQWHSLLFWVGAVLVIVLITIFYQPAAAKTGSLLIWMKDQIYVMDIDSLILERVGPADAGDLMTPSPGCYGQTEAPCWVVAGQNLYSVETVSGHKSSSTTLPLGEGFDWLNDGAVSWSPDGRHLTYYVFQSASNQTELRLFYAATGEMQPLSAGADPEIRPAWSAACAGGVKATGCQLAFKTEVVDMGGDDGLPGLIALDLVTGERREWQISSGPIFELRWSTDNRLLYSRPKRYFRYVEDDTFVYKIPAAGQLGNLSPNGGYTVYYQPFTLADCQADTEEACLHVGVWLTQTGAEALPPRLIYSLDITEARQGGLNFIPIWAPDGEAFVFFQAGNLIYYDLLQQEATIWYKSLQGKLRSVPVFSPNEEAVAFVDSQGQGFSEYRLLVINPRLQPIEHIIETEGGFRVLAWLPN